MESKYLKIGGLVDMRHSGSNATIHNVTVLEIQPFGFFGSQKMIKNAPIRLYPWEQITELTINPVMAENKAAK